MAGTGLEVLAFAAAGLVLGRLAGTGGGADAAGAAGGGRAHGATAFGGTAFAVAIVFWSAHVTCRRMPAFGVGLATISRPSVIASLSVISTVSAVLGVEFRVCAGCVDVGCPV